MNWSFESSYNRRTEHWFNGLIVAKTAQADKRRLPRNNLSTAAMRNQIVTAILVLGILLAAKLLTAILFATNSCQAQQVSSYVENARQTKIRKTKTAQADETHFLRNFRRACECDVQSFVV